MIINYDKVRFFLFANSFSGNKIAGYLKVRFRGGKLTNRIKRLSVVMGFKQRQVANFVLFCIKPDSPYRRFPKSLKVYLEIEKELLKLSEEKLDEYSTATEDYQRQLLYPAIERAVGNFLVNVEGDGKFQMLMEEQFKPACYTYYKVVDKYKLPTMRIIPFLLRIIS